MLRKLKHLNLEHNGFLDMTPRQVISSFSSLQVLRMIHCGIFYETTEDNVLSDSDTHVEELQCLKHLTDLGIAIRSASDGLLDCTQALSLECFSCSKLLDCSWIANMKHLETMHVRTIAHLEAMNVDSIMETTDMQAPSNLYSSIFVRQGCFDSLQELKIEYCSRLWDLRWLIQAPNLAVLKVASCEKMERVINVSDLGGVPDSGENVKPFSRLEVLILEDLQQLKSIYGIVLTFPCLKMMRVPDCPILKKLPLNSSSGKGGKVVIEAEEHWWRDLEWEDDATKAAFQSSLRSCNTTRSTCRPLHDYFFDLWKSLSS